MKVVELFEAVDPNELMYFDETFKEQNFAERHDPHVFNSEAARLLAKQFGVDFEILQKQTRKSQKKGEIGNPVYTGTKVRFTGPREKLRKLHKKLYADIGYGWYSTSFARAAKKAPASVTYTPKKGIPLPSLQSIFKPLARKTIKLNNKPVKVNSIKLKKIDGNDHLLVYLDTTKYPKLYDDLSYNDDTELDVNELHPDFDEQRELRTHDLRSSLAAILEGLIDDHAVDIIEWGAEVDNTLAKNQIVIQFAIKVSGYHL